MQKIQLHSKFTFFRKFILPAWMLLAATYLTYSTIKDKNWIALVIIILVVNGGVYGIRKFLMPLKYVYLDTESRKVFVESQKELIEIPLNNIEKVEEQNRFGKILSVKLKSPTEFGNEFIFVPKDEKVYREIVWAKNQDNN